MNRKSNLIKIKENFGYKGDITEIAKDSYRVSEGNKHIDILMSSENPKLVTVKEMSPTGENVMSLRDYPFHPIVTSLKTESVDPYTYRRSTIECVTLVPTITAQSSYFDRNQTYEDIYSYDENNSTFFTHRAKENISDDNNRIRSLGVSTSNKAYINGIEYFNPDVCSLVNASNLIHLLNIQRSLLTQINFNNDELLKNIRELLDLNDDINETLIPLLTTIEDLSPGYAAKLLLAKKS